jgi:hypothetical protein
MFVAGHSARAQTFTSFADAKSVLLDQMGMAKESIQLYTELLTDADIVSALYLAQYRKVNTTVMLGRADSQHFLSRLRDLKKQHIAVFEAPPQFPTQHRTVLAIDGQIPQVFDAPLDYRTRAKSFRIQTATSPQLELYRRFFGEVLSTGVVPRDSPNLPKVGRASPPGGGVYRQRYPIRPAPYNPEVKDAFRYQTVRGAPVPKDAAKVLPKETIMQKKERQRSDATSTWETSPTNKDAGKDGSKAAPAIGPTPPPGAGTGAEPSRLPNSWQQNP